MRNRLAMTAVVAVLAAAGLAACSAAPVGAPVTRTVTAAPTPSGSTSHRVVVAAPQPVVERPTVVRVTKPKPTPKPNHCASNHAPQQVIVSLAAQHMWFCALRRTVRDTPITSGIVGQYTSTPTGDYQIQGRDRDTVLTLNTGAQYPVHYWIPFDAPLFGFHDSSWQDFPYGSARYRTQGSHGCVHMPLKAIAFLYRWAARPTAVHIS